MSTSAADSTAKAVRRGLALVACLALSLTMASGASAAANVSSTSAKQVLTQSLRNATHAGSVRITVQFFSGSTTGKVVQDSGLKTGEQTVAIGNELASVVLVNSTAYISGNSKGLSSYFGMPSSLVPSIVGHWASVQQSDPSFGSVAGNVTLVPALANVTPSGTLIAGKRTKVDRQWVRSISGEGPDASGRVTLFVTANSRSLPVEAVESSGTSTQNKGEIVTFTRWGETLHLPRPTNAVPLSTLEAAAAEGS
ncbi:MAG TPA: hypothetical protein VN886_10125 [Acidimicrobiales bacterium]|nr:hypothetical protein [Acidimicrobiales bacterium]